MTDQLDPQAGPVDRKGLAYMMGAWKGLPDTSTDAQYIEEAKPVRASRVIEHVIRRLSHGAYKAIDVKNPPNGRNRTYPDLVGSRLFTLPCPYVSAEERVKLFNDQPDEARVEVFYTDIDDVFRGSAEHLIRRLEKEIKGNPGARGVSVSIVPVYLAPKFRLAPMLRKPEWFYLHVELWDPENPDVPVVNIRLPTETPWKYLTTRPLNVAPIRLSV